MTRLLNIKANLDLARTNIQRICLESGRDPLEVELMLVTKTVTPEKISEAFEHGCRLFGENKVQEVLRKWTFSSQLHIKPDFIGHLQTNKVKRCLDVCGRIHSVDRISLVEKLDRELQKRGEQREVLLQVNTSNEDSKYGVSHSKALDFAKQVSRYSTLKVTGLMTLAIFSKNDDEVRVCFRRLAELRRNITDLGIFPTSFKHLSMGMTSDFQIAIQEGATIIRLGQAIFGTRSKPDSYYWPVTIGEQK